MKKLRFNKTLIAALFVACATVGLFSCKKKTDAASSTSSATGTTVVKGEINTDTHWTSDMHVLLSGYVYVTSGHTLTIDAGTVIKADKATKGTLIIEQGATIKAIGTPSLPIIFTSNQPAGSRTYGDWGGVILCGYAKNNWVAASKTDGTVGTLSTGIGQVEGGPRSLYGGGNDADNSGMLQYARIEFGGVAFSPNNEINGLTLCSVGNATVIDHIQVSYSGDDSYEWFGGTVNCNNLVAFKGWDDDFDTDNGYSGTVQFGMIYRDPYAADQSGSHTFESDSRNESSSPAILPITAATFQNVTAVGPLSNPNFNGYNANFVCGQIVRRSSSLSVYNSLIIGFPLGVIVDEDPSFGSTVKNINAGTLKFQNNAIIQTPNSISVITARLNDPHSAPNSISAASQDSSTWNIPAGSGPVGPYAWFMSSNNYFGATEGLTSRLNYAFNNAGTPNFQPASTSYVVQNKTSLPTSGPKSIAGSAAYTALLASPYSYGKYPFNPALPINTDTTNKFANYNAPTWPANQTVANHTNYIGAFISSNDWVANWTNFDPVNANYGAQY